MNFSLDHILQLLLAYKYLLLFPIAVIEGPIITVIGGFLVSTGHMSFWLVFLVVLAGDLVGDTIYYLLGRVGRESLIHRIGRYIGLPPTRIEKLDGHFVRHPGKTLLFGKLTHATGAVVLVAAGLTRMDYWKFIWYNFLGTVPKALVLIVVGYYFGSAYSQIGHYIDKGSFWLFVVIVVLAGAYLLYRYKRTKII